MLTAILALAVGVIIIFLIIWAFIKPEHFKKLFGFILRPISRSFGRKTLTPEEEEDKAKAKECARYAPITIRIDKLVAGQVLRYKIPEPPKWGCDFLNVELNPDSREDGTKYILSMENAINGMPDGKRITLRISGQPLHIAASIMDRDGMLFEEAREAKKVAL